MWPRLSIVAGLLAGVVVAGLVLGGILFLGPGPARIAPATPTPIAVASPSPSQSPSPDPSTSARPSATPSLTAAPSPSSSGSGAPSPSASPLFPSPLHIGEPAPSLVVPRVGGGTIDLANLRDHPVWVDFMGTDCPPCRDEFPLMNGFAARYAGTGLIVLAVDILEDEGTVAAFANELGATFPLGLDTDGTVAASWDAIALPVHFWIDRDGIIRDGALGGIGPDIMARGLASILPGVEVTP